GENWLLLKVHHGSGEYGFLFAPSKQPVTNHPVEFTMAAADYSQSDYPGKAALDDKTETGWAVDGQDEKRRGNRQAVFIAPNPITFEGGTRLKVKLKFESGTNQVIGRFRLAVTDAAGLEEFAQLPQNV